MRKWKRSALRLAIIAVVTYAAVAIVTAVFQRHLIYFPTRQIEALPSDVGLKYEDVSLETADGIRLAGWYVPRDAATATVLFFHGNAGNISHRLATLKILHELGFGVLIIDYRGYGQSEGKPDEEGLYRDADAAWTYLTEDRGEQAGRVVLIGRSLGGAVAIDLATRVKPAALVVESTFTALADVGKEHYPFLPVRLVIGNQYRSIDKIASVGAPKLILHGEEDELIPIELGKALFDAAGEPKKWIATPGGHNEAGFTYSVDYARRMREFVVEAVAR